MNSGRGREEGGRRGRERRGRKREERGREKREREREERERERERGRKKREREERERREREGRMEGGRDRELKKPPTSEPVLDQQSNVVHSLGHEPRPHLVVCLLLHHGRGRLGCGGWSVTGGASRAPGERPH